MSRTNPTLAACIALVTILGMTAVFAAPAGAMLTDGGGETVSLDGVTTSTADTAANDGNGSENGSDDENPPEEPPCDTSGESGNNSAQCDGEDRDDEGDDEDDEDENGEDDEEENGDDEPDEAGTCEEGGAAQENTIANEAFGTEDEDGPISSQIHENEEQFQDGAPLAHEVSCGVATVDNNAPE